MLPELLFMLASSMSVGVAERALDESPVFNPEAWSYTREKASDGKSFLERHVPTGGPGEHWQLIAVDGREPTERELEEFEEEVRETHAEYVEKHGEGDRGGSLIDDVKRDTLAFQKETEESWIFSFTPKSESNDERLTSQLEGSLHIDKQTGFVSRLVVQSSAPFKPRFGVTFKKFLIDSSFRLHPTGELVYSRTHKHIKGSVLVVGSFEQQEESVYTNYERRAR